MLADLLKDYHVSEGRIFTFHLRKGHKWSDGHPFTAEDFRYWWEDVANNESLSPVGPPTVMKVDGEMPEFLVVDDHTVRYTWSKPNPDFLVRLAGASPLYIYRPAHYLKPFHEDYMSPEALGAVVDVPGIIVEDQTSTYVPNGFSAGIAANGYIILDRNGDSG